MKGNGSNESINVESGKIGEIIEGVVNATKGKGKTTIKIQIEITTE